MEAEPMKCDSDEGDYDGPIRSSVTMSGTSANHSDGSDDEYSDMNTEINSYSPDLGLYQTLHNSQLANLQGQDSNSLINVLQYLYLNWTPDSTEPICRFCGARSPPLWTMGNHPSNSDIVVDGRTCDGEQVNRLIDKLKEENLHGHEQRRDLQEEIERLSEQMCRLKTENEDKNDVIRRQEHKIQEYLEEIDKLKCVIQQKVTGGKPDILATISEEYNKSDNNKKKVGISAESSQNITANSAKLQHYDKDPSTRKLIKSAIKNNDFLKNLDTGQTMEIVNCMYKETYKSAAFIIKEGDPGNHFYVSEVGVLEVSKEGQQLGTLPAGRAFGELAILYECNRTASIRALEDVEIWVLERSVFQLIMMKSGIERQQERIKFLQSVESLSNLSPDKLAKIADVLEEDVFEENDYIVREGQNGDTFYVLKDGQVKVTQKIKGYDEPQEIRKLRRGEYFGEKALTTEERRTASVIALSPGVTVLTLNREAFVRHIGDLKEFHTKDYGDFNRNAEWILRKYSQSSSERDSQSDGEDLNLASRSRDPSIESQYKELTINDLKVLRTLGVGGFGRVDLVVLRSDKTKSFALKCLKKQHIVNTGQQQHVYAEKRIMLACHSPFIVNLHRTFKDGKYVYLLMDVCLGGELWTVLRDSGYFEDAKAKFCVACVIEAFRYLHSRKIVYRDLKPENLLLTKHGYVKLVDFGFAKNVPAGRKTWTFCGTPEYVAPEIILNRGHDHAVDIWAMGILIYELTDGRPPFSASDAMKTYNLILKGINALAFPGRISRHAQSLIKKLCQENPVERLGYQRNGLSDVMKHKWFQGFDWEGLRNQSMKPPFRRELNDGTDARYFDNYPPDKDPTPDEYSGWDADF